MTVTVTPGMPLISLDWVLTYAVQMQTAGEQYDGLGCACPSGLLGPHAAGASGTAFAGGGGAAPGSPAVRVHPNTGKPMVSM